LLGLSRVLRSQPKQERKLLEFTHPAEAAQAAAIKNAKKLKVCYHAGLGAGLKVIKRVKKGEELEYYDGWETSRDDALKMRADGKASHLLGLKTEGVCIDGISGADFSADPDRFSMRGWASLANEADGDESAKRQGANAFFDFKSIGSGVGRRLVVLRATSAISTGGDVLVYYDRSYDRTQY
jgi:hypothetical protein